MGPEIAVIRLQLVYHRDAMTDVLVQLLAEREILVADGATGTNLMKAGLETGQLPDAWNTDRPEEVLALHQAFVAAGSDIILTNTFGAGSRRLDRFGLGGRCEDLNAAGAKLARAAADAVGRPVIVAGSMGPHGEMMPPFGELTGDAAETSFAEQAAALAEAGADVLWLESFFILDELSAALRAAAPTGLPLAVTLTFDTAGCTMMGTSPAAALEFVRASTVPVVAFGSNCGRAPGEVVESVRAIADHAGADHRSAGEAIVAKANCGMPVIGDGRFDYRATSADMAAYAQAARAAGAHIVGGCCGTTPAHVAAMSKALTSPRADRP